MESHLICEPHNNQAIRVLRAILNVRDDEDVVPSDYFTEMKMSLEDRLESLCKNRKCRTLPEPCPFLATPDMVIFQNFQPGKWHNATLTLQNKEQSSRCIKTVFEPSIHFRLVHPTKVVWTKVAPGMTYQLIVSFSGDEVKDYEHEITFVTEEERFSIPIYAFKPRPLLDFPDSIKLPDVPIHMTAEKTIIVSNRGSVSGAFNIIATEPCRVCPTKEKLGPGDKMFLSVKFKTKRLGSESVVVVVKFEDEVRLKMVVQCIGVASTIILNHDSISFEDTFIGLRRQVPLTFEYHAIGVGNFKWKMYKDRGTDDLRRLQLTQAFEQVRDTETLRSKPNLIEQEGHETVYDRILRDEVEEVEASEEFLFQSCAFSIVPLMGEMGLNGLLEFTVIFHPSRCEQYETFAYLEIAGREDRIPLKLQGTGLGPEFKLNVAHLEANNIFLCSEHSYEIIVANTGHVPGSITFIDKELEFGGKIESEPETLEINADHYGVFIVAFTPGEEGKFIEKVEFVVNESQEKIHFIMTGNVLAPLLNFEIDEINFGVVALGYLQEKEVILCNNSPVPIQYKVEIENDGYREAVDCTQHLQGVPFPDFPREFHFEPTEGVVDIESKIVGQLKLLPNVRRVHTSSLVVRMWGSKNYCISVPIKYDCRVADIVCVPSKIDIKFCFIDYVYDRKVILKNKSDLPCHFTFVKEENDDVSVISHKYSTSYMTAGGLIVEMTVPRNHIPPLGELKIPLKIQTAASGTQELPLYVNVFGKGAQILCQVIVNGQGPAICFIPQNLNFGTVKLLDTVTKEMEILNDTPIPAKINFSFVKQGDFSINEPTKVIPPNSKQEFEVSVYLRNPGKHSQVLVANVAEGQDVAVSLTAYGEGTSISCSPKLEPKYDLGVLLTHKKFSFPVVLRNEGSRWHKLWFSRSDNLKVAKESGNSSAGSVFKINPNYFHLMTNESNEIKISASRNEQGYVCEHFYCHAVIEKSHLKKYIIFSFEVTGKFVDPHVIFSKSELDFFLNVSSDGVFVSLRDKLKIRNESGLAVEIELMIRPPFYIVVDGKSVGQLCFKLNNLSNRTIFVEFQPPPHLRRCMNCNQILYVSYMDHPKVDTIPARGVINYPTLSIQPHVIDFGCVPIGSSTQQAVVLRNVSALPVIFKWVWVDELMETKIDNSVVPSTPELPYFHAEESKETVVNEDYCFTDDKVRDMLNSIIDDVEESDEERNFLRLLPDTVPQTKFSQIFTIIPHEGCLEPDQMTKTYFKFTPRPNTEVSAVVYCHIVGGANEPVTLTGKCKQLSFFIKDAYIDFGKICFHEISESEAAIVNNGEGSFTFEVSEASWLTVEPSSGSLSPGETFPLVLKCFPGGVGRFQTSFTIEVAYLEPAVVTVYGFGVYPQIYFSLPRPDFDKIDPCVSYAAIAELGDERDSCKCVHEYFPETDRRILEDDDWVVVSLCDHVFPCAMEIDLSIERIYAKDQLTKDPNLLDNLASGEKYWPIPNFVLPAYVYDLGCVQIDTKMLYNLSYLNYGPNKTAVKIQISNTFSKQGFDAPLVRSNMELNQINNLHFSFFPTVDKYPELNTKITEFIYVEVRNGPRIPIQLEVLVATPTVDVPHEEIDFGSIRCGDCLRKSVNIFNNGFLTSRWRAKIEENLKSKTKPSFFLLQHEGSLEPGDKFYLRVYFEPHYDDFLNADLVITVDGNFREIVVQLKGLGMEPFLEIADEKLVFEPNIPYSSDNEKCVTLRNASKFPVEFFFPDFDEKILQEEVLTRAFILGHRSSKVYFPYRAPGDSLPPMFQTYHDELIREMETRMGRRRSSLGTSGTRSKAQSPSPSSLKLEDKSHFEKDNIITSYLLKKMKYTSSPALGVVSRQQLTPDDEKPHEDPPPKGILVVFHGSPESSYIKAAHETSKALCVPVYTIDRLIIECLVQNHSPAAAEINNIIEEAFSDVAEEQELESSPAEDSYDVILKKVFVLLEGRRKKMTKKPKNSARSMKSGKSTKSSKKSSKSGSKKSIKKKKVAVSDTLLNISPELLSQVLEESVRRFPKGLIIESLLSNFLRKTMVALNGILQLSKCVAEIYFAIFLCTFDEYIALEDEKEERRKEEAIKALEDIAGSIDEMDSDEFAKLKNDYPDIYKEYINKRKQEIIGRKLKKNKQDKRVTKTKKKSRESSKSSSKKKESTKSTMEKSRESSKSSSKKKESSRGATKSRESSKSSSKKKGSSRGSRKSSKEKKKRKLTKEQAEVKQSLDSFEDSLLEILHTLDFWDKTTASLSKPLEKTKKKPKTKRGSSASLADSERTSPDVGVPYWLLNRALHHKFEELVPNLMQQTVASEVSHEQKVRYEYIEPPLLQSVLPKPKSRTTKKADIFCITDYIEGKTGSRFSFKSEKEIFTYRGLLQPGDSIKYKIQFLPKAVGNYKHQFEIGVVGWPAKFSISCVAISDIPRIDMEPYVLFDKVAQYRTDRNKYAHCLFVEDTNMYEFGGILLPNASRAFEARTCFHLNNISRITCDVLFSIEEDSSAFQFQPESHIIKVKERKELSVVAAPLEEKTYEDSLIMSIKNNPKVEKVRMSCYGSDIAIDVNPKHVSFERVTLEISLTQDIVITNNTPVEVSWYFVNCEEVLENFKIRNFGGKIAPFSSQTSTVEFTAKKIAVGSSTFQANIYDNQARLLYSTDIIVSAETTTLEFSYDNELHYGDVKGWKSHTVSFNIINKGRYDILCTFSKIAEEGQLRRKYFQIKPPESKLVSNVKFEADVTFTPNRAMVLEKFPVFQCSLIDPFHQVLLKSFDIFVSARVFLSKFEMCPYPEIYFGYQTVGSEQVHLFQLVNKGKFDFNYDIKNYHERVDTGRSKGSKSSKKSKSSKHSEKERKKDKPSSSKSSKKSSKTTEKKGKKRKPTTLKVGIFSLTPSTGTVDPNEEAMIEVRSNPTKEGEHQETIIVHVSEPSHQDLNGKILKVHVVASEPRVNFDDINYIFKEQYTVERVDDFLLSNIEAKVIFAKSEMKLKFNKVCVNTTETTRIRIQNVGHVIAHVTAKFLYPSHVFTVEDDSFSIDPYQDTNVMIIFTPNSLDEHYATLVFECQGFNTLDRLIVDLVGEACVPEIQLLEPEPDEESFITLYYPPALVGTCLTQKIVLKNVGVIPCKVIIEVCFDDFDQLSLIPSEETIPCLNLWEPTMKHTNLVNLERERIAVFVLKFEPRKVGTWKLEVKIHTVNNPFETKTIHVFCEGYYTDVILEGLISYSRSVSCMSIGNVPVLGYSLDFGHVSLNTLERKCFSIKNNSDVNTYKFEFPAFSEVIFSPAVGHIKPKTSKQLLAVFLSKNPVDLYNTRIECKVYRIEYLQPQPGLLSWDDRQHLVVWYPETDEDDGDLSMKKIEDNPEPEIDNIVNTSQNIALFLTVVADFASFVCDVQELNFPDTFLMNKHSTSFEVENTGNAIVKMSWTIGLHELPRRINSSMSLRSEKQKCPLKTNTKRKPTPLTDEQFLYEDALPRPASSSTLFSCDTLDTNRSTDSWNESQVLPFTVAPDKATIPPNSRESFTVTFGPTDVFDYVVQLKSSTENKSPKMNEIEIQVKARSILPVYCFDLEPSDYMEMRRRGKKMCDDLMDENTKVVEFESVGLGVICTRKFYLKNPTKEEFFYNWQPAHPVNPHLSCFHCHTPNGVVNRGKTVEMVFSFIPQDCGIFEEFYFFNILLKNIQATFLLVGTAREPRIFFDQSHITLPPTVVGIDVSDTVILKNEENQKYSFKFGKISMLSEGLSIQPISGVLDPSEACPIKVFYAPRRKGSFTSDLKCFVEKIKTPLGLSVSWNCFEVEATASYVDQNGKETQLFANKINVINMGLMVPHQKYEVPFTVINIGKTAFQWYWDMRIEKISGLFDIVIDANEEILQPNETLQTKITITPLIKCRMQAHKIYFKIPYGPTYALQLSGNAGRPPFRLSFSEYNFGPCLVQKSTTKYYKTVLKFSNFNIWPMTLEQGKHSTHISTDFQSAEVPPQGTKDITIYFHPLILGQHQVQLPLYVDGKRTHVTISGKAVPLRLTFVSQTDKFIDLGSVLVDKISTKTVRVLNESECPINIRFNFWDRLPKRPAETPDKSLEVSPEEPKSTKSSQKTKKDNKKGSKSTKSSKKTKKGSTKGSTNDKKEKTESAKETKESQEKIQAPKQGTDYMTITPDKCVRVGTQKTTEFTVSFSPKERVQPFVEKIFYRAQDYIDALCIVKGGAIAPDVSLDRYYLTFGNVVVNFERKMKVVLRNTGDVQLKFKWLLNKKEDNFSIVPNKGYILPGTDLPFNVIFRPKAVKCWIKSKLICHIAQINKQLQLEVVGTCINVPPPKGTILFSCPVRECDTKTMSISNPTNQVWDIMPHVSGDPSFKTLEITRIPPKSENDIEIIYAPMQMAQHNATLCLPTPDGLIVSYNLKGVANPPTPVDKMIRDVLCKVQHLERLPVTNWLLVKQQFQVSTTINGTVSTRNLFSVGGNALIEVPPNSTRIYDWSITPINEGPLDLKVTFTNKQTKEYLFYEISLKVLPNKELDSIEFSTCARVPITKLVKLENPLNIPVVYHLMCPKENLVFEKTVTLEPHSVYYLEIIYKPLEEERGKTKFEASCKEMGTFCYSLLLTAYPPVPDPAIIFKTFLGQTLTQNVEVIETRGCNFKFDDSAFSLNAIVTDHTLSVSFYPDQVGKCQSRLVVKSPTVGEYIYPLIGESCPPKPQGPFLVTFSNPAVISFKNPFSEEKEFSFRTEPSEFVIKTKSKNIGAKEVYKAVVSLLTQRRKAEVKYSATGKLTVTCDSPATSWVYYLQEDI